MTSKQIQDIYMHKGQNLKKSFTAEKQSISKNISAGIHKNDDEALHRLHPLAFFSSF